MWLELGDIAKNFLGIGGDKEEEDKDVDQESEDNQEESADENSDKKKNPEEGETFNPANDIQTLRKEVVDAYLNKLNKKDFVKWLIRGKKIKAKAREYILEPKQEEEQIDLSWLNLPPEVSQFADVLKGSGSGFLPSMLKKFTGVSIGFDEEKELNPMRELMAKDEYKTDKVKLEELKKSIKGWVDIKTLLVVPAVVWTGVVAANTSSESWVEKFDHVKPIENTDDVKITSKFGPRKHPVTWEKDNHTWIDLAANEWASISSICDGEVLENRKTDLWWNELVIKWNDGKTYYYLHMQKKSELDEWEKVKSGDVIWYVWETGRSTWPHLHITIKENDKSVDPLAVLPEVFDDYKVVA